MNFEKQPPKPLDYVSERLLSQCPLHFACYRGDGQLLNKAIGNALRLNDNDEEAGGFYLLALIAEEDGINGWTPAHWAAFYGQLSCLMKLHVKPNVGFDTPTHRTNTSPLHLAAQAGAVLCLKWLLQCGSAINRQDFMGETALHKACKAGNADSAAMLVSHGACLEVKNYRGLSAADVAEQAQEMVLASYLRRYSQVADQKTHSDLTDSPGSQLPISDLGAPVPFPSSLPPDHLPHPDHARYSSFPYTSKISQTPKHDVVNSCISMNGEIINNTDHCQMEQCDSEMLEHDKLEDCSSALSLPSIPSVSTKRSLDCDDVSEDHLYKRRCLSSGQERSHEEKYGNANNNNIISSYNAILAVRVDPAIDVRKTPSPVLPQSSVMEHEASVMAQQGYDRTVRNTVANAFF